MGSSVEAVCECGVEEPIFVGGGMADCGSACFFPCLCERCKSVVRVNLLAKRKRCPKCGTTRIIPYDAPQLSDGPGTEIITSWNTTEQLGRARRQLS